MGQLYIKEFTINIVHIFVGPSISPVNLEHPWCMSSQIMRPPARDAFWEIISKDQGFRE